MRPSRVEKEQAEHAGENGLIAAKPDRLTPFPSSRRRQSHFCDELCEATREALSYGYPGRSGLLRCVFPIADHRRPAPLDVCVSPRLIERSMQMIKLLLRCLEPAGCRIHRGERPLPQENVPWDPPAIIAHGECISLRVREITRRLEWESEDRLVSLAMPHSEPTGRLYVRLGTSIDARFFRSVRTRWEDTDGALVEDYVSEIVDSAVQLAVRRATFVPARILNLKAQGEPDLRSDRQTTLPGSDNTSPSNRTVKIALKNKREIQVSENIQPDVLRRLIAVLEGD